MVLDIGEVIVRWMVTEQNKKNEEFPARKKSGWPKNYLDHNITKLI